MRAERMRRLLTSPGLGPIWVLTKHNKVGLLDAAFNETVPGSFPNTVSFLLANAVMGASAVGGFAVSQQKRF
jgi:hypothetical protein